jgi:hypothetical protein
VKKSPFLIKNKHLHGGRIRDPDPVKISVSDKKVQIRPDPDPQHCFTVLRIRIRKNLKLIAGSESEKKVFGSATLLFYYRYCGLIDSIKHYRFRYRYKKGVGVNFSLYGDGAVPVLRPGAGLRYGRQTRSDVEPELLDWHIFAGARAKNFGLTPGM